VPFSIKAKEGSVGLWYYCVQLRGGGRTNR
jgi:hypothetical protein